MYQLIFSIIISYLAARFIIIKLLDISILEDLLDQPDDVRKFHRRAVSPFGGVALFIGLILSIGLNDAVWINSREFPRYFVAFVMIFFLGLKDDLVPIPAGKKLLGQILVASVITFDNNFLVSSLQGLFGIYNIPILASYLVTVLAVVLIINAYNLIDGADGLAGSLGLFATFIFGLYFIFNGFISYGILALSFTTCLFVFLLYNFEPAKIFMGDSGSMLTGLVISILGIKFVELAPTATRLPVASSLVVVFGLLLFPIMDMFRVFVLRLKTGKSPFKADRIHAHHLLVDRGRTHKNLVLLICCGSLIFFTGALFFTMYFNTTISFLILICLFLFYLKLLLNVRMDK
jgi:UDP-N-acetylmuramyl pentapeptide phosphotransferase/UDP-N-acetylglucosamine-1-phosphate transferase